MPVSVRMSKSEARRRGFTAGEKLASRVPYSPLGEVMAAACIGDRRSTLKQFEGQLKRVSPLRAEVLHLAFYQGLVSGISHTIRKRRSNAK